MNSSILKSLIFCMLILALASFAGCKKGDDDNDDDSSDNGGIKSVTFQPAGSAGAGDIWLELESSSPGDNRFSLRVKGDGLTVYGVAGRLEFDPAICTLTGAQSGDALEGGTAKIVAAGGASDEGGVFGISRSGDFQTGADLKADRNIGVLEFSILSPGSTKISFTSDHSRVMNQNLESVEVAHWLGGTLAIK